MCERLAFALYMHVTFSQPCKGETTGFGNFPRPASKNFPSHQVGGLSAIFQIENGFDLNTGKLGQGGAEFGRQAWVGIASKSYGTLTAGRQYDSVVDFARRRVPECAKPCGIAVWQYRRIVKPDGSFQRCRGQFPVSRVAKLARGSVL